MTAFVASCRRIVLRAFHGLRPGHAETDLARELAAHLALLEDEYRRRGLSPQDARRAARRAIGGVEQAKQLHRDARSFIWLDDARRDVWQLLRSLNRHRGFAAVTILTLAIGIGANTALFSAFNAVVLRPLPYRDPASLVVIAPSPVPVVSNATIARWRAATRQVTDFAGFNGTESATLIDGGRPSGIDRAVVTSNFLAFLGVPIIAGRDFAEADSRPGAPHVAIMSHDTWRIRFNSDPGIVGRELTIGGEPVTVVGITAPSFRFPATGLIPATGVSESLQPAVLVAMRGDNSVNVLGRLAPGATPERAGAELLPAFRDVAMARFAQSFRNTASIRVDRLHERLAGPLRQWLVLVMGTVALVLLVACANVANLLLVRASARRREFALRAAIGARLGRLVRLVVTESVVLALIAAGFALALTAWVGAAARPLLADRMPHVASIAIDWWVFTFNVAVGLGAGLGCGLISLSSVRGLDVAAAFNDSSTPAVSSRSGMRRALVGVEVGLTFVLVLGAVLLAQTVRHLQDSDHGFDARGILTLRLSMAPGRLQTVKDLQAANAVLDRFRGNVSAAVSAVPGVESIGMVTMGPLAPSGVGFTGVRVEGIPPPTAAERDMVNTSFVSPAYFETMRTPMVEGRTFRETDVAGAEPVVIVNEAFVRHFGAGRRSLAGMRVVVDGRALTIVGVVHDVSARTFRDTIAPILFMPLPQMAEARMFNGLLSVMVRTVGVPPARTANDVQRAIWSVDPNAVIADVVPMEGRVAAAMQTERQSAAIFTALAAIALLIAAIGVYGVGSYAVAQRTKELGIRVALGAERRDVIRLIGGHLLVPTLAGLLLGVPIAAAATRVLASLLYGVTPLDIPSFAAAGAVLAMAAVVATIAPIRRVLRLDPLEALRVE